MMKKVLSLVLVLTLVLALAVPAFALDQKDEEIHKTNLTIKIENALVGQYYTVYRVLDVVTYDSDKQAYRYDLAKKADGSYFMTWEAFEALSAEVDGETKTVGNYLQYNEAQDGKHYVTWKDETVNGNTATEHAGAQQLAQILRANNTALIEAASRVKAESTVVEFTGLTAGYYLVDSTAGVLCGMDTAQKVGSETVVIIKEKNKLPTPDKDVKEDSTGAWVKKNTADIGDTVEFRLVIEAQPGAENYVAHDKMTKGLAWQANTVVVEEFPAGKGRDGLNKVQTLTAWTSDDVAWDYKVVTPATAHEGEDEPCTFEIVFSETYLDKTFGKTDSAAKDLVVTYKAVVTPDAKVNSNENTNEFKLTYGDKNYTEPITTQTYTFDFKIHKYGTTSQDGNHAQIKLADAHFELYTDKEAQHKVYFDKIDLGTGENAVQEYRMNSVATTTEEKGNSTSDLVTPASGDIRLYGLDAATYYLKETKAPAGYNLIDVVIEVVVNEEGLVSFKEIKDGAVASTPAKSATIQIENKTGAELPSTGGIGTTIFYVIGGLLVCAAVVLLVTKKKVGSN